jgi:hypothetical protein
MIALSPRRGSEGQSGARYQRLGSVRTCPMRSTSTEMSDPSEENAEDLSRQRSRSVSAAAPTRLGCSSWGTHSPTRSRVRDVSEPVDFPFYPHPSVLSELDRRATRCKLGPASVSEWDSWGQRASSASDPHLLCANKLFGRDLEPLTMLSLRGVVRKWTLGKSPANPLLTHQSTQLFSSIIVCHLSALLSFPHQHLHPRLPLA